MGNRGPQRAAVQVFQSVHLLLSTKLDKLAGYRPLLPAQKSPEIAGKQEQSPEDIGLCFHLVEASEYFPERMSAQKVVLFSKSETR